MACIWVRRSAGSIWLAAAVWCGVLHGLLVTTGLVAAERSGPPNLAQQHATALAAATEFKRRATILKDAEPKLINYAKALNSSTKAASGLLNTALAKLAGDRTSAIPTKVTTHTLDTDEEKGYFFDRLVIEKQYFMQHLKPLNVAREDAFKKKLLWIDAAMKYRNKQTHRVQKPTGSFNYTNHERLRSNELNEAVSALQLSGTNFFKARQKVKEEKLMCDFHQERHHRFRAEANSKFSEGWLAEYERKELEGCSGCTPIRAGTLLPGEDPYGVFSLYEDTADACELYIIEGCVPAKEPPALWCTLRQEVIQADQESDRKPKCSEITPARAWDMLNEEALHNEAIHENYLRQRMAELAREQGLFEDVHRWVESSMRMLRRDRTAAFEVKNVTVHDYKYQSSNKFETHSNTSHSLNKHRTDFQSLGHYGRDKHIHRGVSHELPR